MSSDEINGLPNQSTKKLAFKVERTDEVDETMRKRSISSPNMSQQSRLQIEALQDEHTAQDTTKTKKKHTLLRKLFRRGDRSSGQHKEDNSHSEEEQEQETRNNQRLAELAFAHTLMMEPGELDTDLTVAKPTVIQTVCSPSCFSNCALQLDRLFYRIDAANSRIVTLSKISGTTIMAKDYTTWDFLKKMLQRIRRQQVGLFKDADKLLSKFKECPEELLLCHSSDTSFIPIPGEKGVMFDLQEVEEGDNFSRDDLRWEMNSLSYSTENSSTESEDDGTMSREVAKLAKHIRQTEGKRFKQKKYIFGYSRKPRAMEAEKLPPPPNPLGHSRRAILRAHTTVPSSLNLSAVSAPTSYNQLGDAALTQMKMHDIRIRGNKPDVHQSLPFNLLSLTGQLTWLVAQYIDEESSTYKWANDIIHQITRMSVTKSTWLNVHQQLRDTTELLYTHRGREELSSKSATLKGQIAWNQVKNMFQSLPAVANDSVETLTVTTGRRKIFDTHNSSSHELVHLSKLMEKKFHLAYVCDLILWRAHKILFANHSVAPDQTVKYQLIDFRIRNMQLRLDQANVQNWPWELSDWLIHWVREAMNEGNPDQTPPVTMKPQEDTFSVNELKLMKLSVARFENLVNHLMNSEFLTEDFLLLEEPHSDTQSVGSGRNSLTHHSHHYHPHIHHHGGGGHQQDLRPLDPDRCSSTYSALVRQINEYAMSERPLGYFAERALCDIAMELGCVIDWGERMVSLMSELKLAYDDWEYLLKSKLDPNLSDKLFSRGSQRRRREETCEDD